MGILDQFVGEKIPAAFNKDTQPGYYVRGPITEVSVANRTDYKTGDVLYFKDGKPKQQIVITIQTSIRDPQIDDDDGRRRVYVKMDYKSEREGLRDAVRAAGDDDVRVGGELAAQFLGQLAAEDGQPQAWNTTRYEYKKPSSLAAATGGIPGGEQPAPPIPAAPAQPTLPAAPAQDPAAIAAQMIAQRQAAAAPVAAPAAPQVDPATSAAVRGLITAGFTDDQIAQAFPTVQRELIVALRNAAAMASA